MALGLTGGVATGKSTAAEVLASLGAKVIDADRIAHEVLEPEGEAYPDVVAFFGRSILTDEGKIDRQRLGRIVFSSPDKRQQLEKITHPHIISEIEKRLEKARDSNKIVLEAPLLFEAGLENLIEEIWVISARLELQIARLKNRDGLDREEALKRIKAQLSLKEKMKRADLVIKNNGTRKEFEEKIEKAWKGWLSRKGGA